MLAQSYDLRESIAAMPQAEAFDSTKASLERIKKQLTTSGRFLLQGPLLKRSETLRKWNQRWFTLDPTTGKLEYRMERGDIATKGSINFDASSSIIVSPINLQGSIKYDGCCIYIQNSTKKEYFLCADTPGAAQAWVSTLRATQLVLKAHKGAVSSLGGNGSSAHGTVAAVVAAANATAKEAAKELAAAMQSSSVVAPPLDSKGLEATEAFDGVMDNLSIMKETLRVKDEELCQMAKDIRARDATIKELAGQLSETAEAAEAAASAAHIMDNERKAVRSEIAKLRKELDEKVQLSTHELNAVREKLSAAEKARDSATKEMLLWRGELAKAREHAVIMEGALARAEETARQAAAMATGRVDAHINGAAMPEAAGGGERQPSDAGLSLPDNGVEDLLLDLEFVEQKKASLEKEKAPASHVNAEDSNKNASDGFITQKADDANVP